VSGIRCGFVMRRAVLDTDIFSEVVKNRNPVVRARAAAYISASGRLTISLVTVLEVVKGLHKAQREADVQRFLARLSSLEVLPLDLDAAILAGRIYGDLERTGQPIGRADPMIAATAIVHDRVLVTGNGRHYERIRQLTYALDLDNWRGASSPRAKDG
jgi:tRNA(fMet)-specific endonuclease VapC